MTKTQRMSLQIKNNSIIVTDGKKVIDGCTFANEEEKQQAITLMSVSYGITKMAGFDPLEIQAARKEVNRLGPLIDKNINEIQKTVAALIAKPTTAGASQLKIILKDLSTIG